jgi:hypothetical protein
MREPERKTCMGVVHCFHSSLASSRLGDVFLESPPVSRMTWSNNSAISVVCDNLLENNLTLFLAW